MRDHVFKVVRDQGSFNSKEKKKKKNKKKKHVCNDNLISLNINR